VISIVCIYALLPWLSTFSPLRRPGFTGGAFFVGVGGYLSALLNTKMGLSPALRAGAALTGGVVCTLLLMPAFRSGSLLRHRDADVPSFPGACDRSPDILGGTDGILASTASESWLEQYFVIIVVLVLLFGLRRLVNTTSAGPARGQGQRPGGEGLRHEHHRYKAMAVFIASPSAASPRLHLQSTCGRDIDLRARFSVLPIAATVIGGSGTLVGPLDRMPHPGPVSELLGLRHSAHRFLFLDPAGLHRLSQRGLMIYGQRKYHQLER